MPLLTDLPPEIICLIAEVSTWGPVSRFGGPFPLRDSTHAALARTTRSFHSLLNPRLYRRNLQLASLEDHCVLRAAAQGNLDTIKVAHSYGADLNFDGFGRPKKIYESFCATPLHWAIHNSRVDVFDYLIDNGVDLNLPSSEICSCVGEPGAYPLHIALVHINNQVLCRYFATRLVEKGAYLSAEGTHALPELAEACLYDLVEMFLPQADPDNVNEILRLVASRGDAKLFSSILQHPHADVNHPDPKSGRTSLHKAFANISPGHMEVLKLLIAQPNLQLSPQDRSGNTPLHVALLCNPHDNEMVQLLLKQPGTNVAMGNRTGRRPVHAALLYGAKDVFNTLLAHPDVDFHAVDSEGFSLLHFACLDLGHSEPDWIIEVIDIVLDRGVPIDASGTESVTPLQIAIRRHRYGIALHLLSRGADPFIRCDRMKWSLYHYCVQVPRPSHLELVRELLLRGLPFDDEVPRNHNHGFDMDANDLILKSEGTPLFFAAIHPDAMECMKLLLEAGARPNTMVVNRADDDYDVDDFGQTGQLQLFLPAVFRHIWRRCNRVAVQEIASSIKDRISLLLEYGAQIGGGGAGRSALDFACKRTTLEEPSFALLNLLLEKATSAHVGRQHIRLLIETYWGYAPTVRALIAFMDREFPDQRDLQNDEQ